MAKALSYKKIRELRKLIWSEIESEFKAISVEHYMLAEMRLQSVIMAGLDDDDVKVEKISWQKK